MEYILFIYNDTIKPTQKEDWETFFSTAKQSGLFRGGSEIGNRILLGNKNKYDLTSQIVGFMKFESESLDELKRLLKIHPIILSGGTLELCEMPKTKT